MKVILVIFILLFVSVEERFLHLSFDKSESSVFKVLGQLRKYTERFTVLNYYVLKPEIMDYVISLYRNIFPANYVS